MKVSKNLRLRFFILMVVFGILMGCGSIASQPDTAKKEQQIQENIGDKQKVRQATGTYTKEIPFKVTPLRFEVYSDIFTICDTLNLENLNIAPGDLLDYNIYLYVHPLDHRTYWERQGPAAASVKWMAQADLKVGRRIIPIRDGNGFQIIAVLVRQSLSVTDDEAKKNISDTLPGTVRNLGELRQLEGVHIISEVRTAIFRRHK
jgi:hypothetical protein